MKERHIQTLSDISKLTPDEFKRFLPDFVAWHEWAYEAWSTGFVHSQGMQWVDDGNPGVVTYVDLIHDGKTTRFLVEKDGTT